MKLPDHGRYDYSAAPYRKKYDWPGGKRIAFHFSTNIEIFAFGAGLGHAPAAVTPPPDHRGHAWRDYGLRVGAWAVFDMLDELKLPANHLINSAMYGKTDVIFERIRQRGDEIVGHGRTNAERQGILWEEDEARLIKEATDAIRRNEGKAPGGWMAPWMSHSSVTPDLLKEAGYKYLMDWPADEQPFWMRTRSGPILSVPYPIELNDVPQMLNRQHTPWDFKQMIIDQFEEMLHRSAKWPVVMGVSTHMMVVGQPYRLRQLREALSYIRNHKHADKVWFTRPRDIAKFIYGLPPGVVPGSEWAMKQLAQEGRPTRGRRRSR
ncbi:MAG: polysaccharide deacetylase family protein [Alphaproteobacteria bacterium]|nr:polysaccharide deacetylase family protein [Alphaproteobacteria bacterium]